MTGAPCKTIRFDDSTVVPLIESGQLWRDLMFYDGENYIMSASTPGEDTFTETGNRPGEFLFIVCDSGFLDMLIGNGVFSGFFL